MNKKLMIGLGVLAVAGIGLYMWKKNKSGSDEKSDFLGFGKKKKKKNNVKENKGKHFGWMKGLGNKHKDDIATIQATQSQPQVSVMSGQTTMPKGFVKHFPLPLPYSNQQSGQATQSQPQTSVASNPFNQPRMFRGFKRF